MVLMAELIWMQISIPVTSEKIRGLESKVQSWKFKTRDSKTNRLKGFTFLEIMVVLTLVMLLIGMAVPQFFALFSKPHESEFKHLNSVLKILRNDAVLKGTSYCLIFDLKLQQMMSAEESESGKCGNEYMNKPKFLKPHEFPQNLQEGITYLSLLPQICWKSTSTVPDLLLRSCWYSPCQMLPNPGKLKVKALRENWSFENNEQNSKPKTSHVP